MLLRLQKYLADHGVGSRRKCEEYIRDGLVKVNGKVVTEMGTKVDSEKDRIETTHELNIRKQDLVYYAFHKPVGYVCTVTGKEGPKITELLTEISERVFPIGRLDKLTAGLLLLTNDGRFAYEVSHPKFEKEKEYVVKVRETIGPQHLGLLHETFYIKGKKTREAGITSDGPHRLRIVLHEGRNRQIRRMCERAGLQIERLKRVRIGDVSLGTLASGEYRKLTSKEVLSLRQSEASPQG